MTIPSETTVNEYLSTKRLDPKLTLGDGYSGCFNHSGFQTDLKSKLYFFIPKVERNERLKMPELDPKSF